MSSSHEEMMKLYERLNINEKRNEFSSLLEKTNQIISELLRMEQIENEFAGKGYGEHLQTDALIQDKGHFCVPCFCKAHLTKREDCVILSL